MQFCYCRHLLLRSGEPIFGDTSGNRQSQQQQWSTSYVIQRYAEKQSNGGNGDPTDGYMRKHEPFISYINIQNNEANCKNIVNASYIQDDSNNFPDVSFYIPNQIDA